MVKDSMARATAPQLKAPTWQESWRTRPRPHPLREYRVDAALIGTLLVLTLPACLYGLSHSSQGSLIATIALRSLRAIR